MCYACKVGLLQEDECRSVIVFGTSYEFPISINKFPNRRKHNDMHEPGGKNTVITIKTRI